MGAATAATPDATTPTSCSMTSPLAVNSNNDAGENCLRDLQGTAVDAAPANAERARDPSRDRYRSTRASVAARKSYAVHGCCNLLPRGGRRGLHFQRGPFAAGLSSS